MVCYTFERIELKTVFHPEAVFHSGAPLGTSHDLPLPLPRLQRFLADFRDLTSWVTEMKALINADELANDVAGAEALLDRHQEHKVTRFSRSKEMSV